MPPTALPFAITPGYLARQASPTALKVYVALALRANHETGECWPSHALIAEDTGVSVRTVIRALNELVTIGAVERTHRKGETGDQTSNLYRLPFAVNRRAHPPMTDLSPPHDNGDTTPVTRMADELDPFEPERALYDKNDDFHSWAEARWRKRGGGPKLLEKILAEDREVWEEERRRSTGGTNPSPPRNQPDVCRHRALDIEGWCAACMTQVKVIEHVD